MGITNEPEELRKFTKQVIKKYLPSPQVKPWGQAQMVIWRLCQVIDEIADDLERPIEQK